MVILPLWLLPNDPSRNANSQALASGINSAIQGLVQHKVGQIQAQKDAADIRSAFPELPHGAVNFLASQPAKERMEFLQQYSSGLQQLQQQQEQQTVQQQGLQALQSQQQEMQQRPQQPSPYAPGFQGARQHEYGGREQQQQQAIGQQVKQAQQQLAKPKPQPKSVSLAQGLGGGAVGKGAALVDNKRQAQIDKKNAPFNKDIDKFREQGEDIVNDAKTALDLIDSGKVQFGLWGSALDKLPLGSNLMNDETQQFVSTINDLVDKDSAFTKGVATNFKIKLKQAAKAHLGLSQASAKKVVERILREKQKFLDLAQARDQILEENGGIEPDNLSMLTRKRFENWERNKGPKEDPSDYSDDAIIRANNVLYEKSTDRRGWTIYKGAI